jgi:hypothetical protein
MTLEEANGSVDVQLVVLSLDVAGPWLQRRAYYLSGHMDDRLLVGLQGRR